MFGISKTPEGNKITGLLIKYVEMTGLKNNCSLLSTINTILASKLSVEIPCDSRKVKDSKVLPNSSLQTYLTFIQSKHVFPNLCNIRQFVLSLSLIHI